MANSELDSALNSYQCELKELENSSGNPSKENILKIFWARDRIRTALINTDQIPPEKILKIVELDNRLKKQAGAVTQAVSLPECRAIFHPPQHCWWWFLEPPQEPLERFDLIWNFITVVLLTIAISLGVDIASRFLSGGLDWLSSIVLGFQALLTLIAGSALTNANAALKFIQQFFHLLNVKKYSYQKGIQLGLSGLLLILAIAFRNYLPEMAADFNDRGLDNYVNDQVATAQADFERAIGLNPDNAEAHYNLGRLYEDLQDLDKAKQRYRLALRGNLDVAYNALGRLLLIHEKKYSQAVSMFLQGLDVASTTDNTTRAVLFKNLGWARLGQKLYSEAETALREAIQLDSTLASAHCLLAEVLDQKQGAPKSAIAEWKICLRDANPRYPEEDAWIIKARQRIDNQGK